MRQNMVKKFLFFFIGYSIAAFACFALMYWVFDRGMNHSLETTLLVGVSLLVVELIRYFRKKRSFLKQKHDAPL